MCEVEAQSEKKHEDDDDGGDDVETASATHLNRRRTSNRVVRAPRYGCDATLRDESGAEKTFVWCASERG